MTSARDAALARLESLVERGHFSSAQDALETFSIDGAAPRACVTASSAEQAADILRLAAEENLAVVPVGSGAQLGYGMPPARYDVALRVGLADVISYDPGDLTLSVGAGMSLGALNLRLAEHSQFLPLDSFAGNFATVGGALATNSTGPLRHAFGTARDFLLGLEFISGEGVRAKSGSRVVKSVSGYDIHKLMVGSLGTLGVISSANFRTFPRPPARATFRIRLRDAAGAFALIRAVALSQLQPRALDIVSPELACHLKHHDAAADALAVPEFDWEDARAYVGAEKAEKYRQQTEEVARQARAMVKSGQRGPLFSPKEWTVLVLAAGNERVVERHCRELEAMAERAGASGFSEAQPVTGEESKISVHGCEEWRWLRTFPDVLRQASPAVTLLKVTAMPSQLETLLGSLRARAEAFEFASTALVRAAGIIYFALLPPRADERTLADLAELVEACHTAETLKAGATVVEMCPATLKQRVNVWGPPREDIELMRRIKQEFDPRGILSPGRFVV
jgi:FAD/FMN-containing dehydrogenase